MMPSWSPSRFFVAKSLIYQKEICNGPWFSVVSAPKAFAKSLVVQRGAAH
jgi:hypothetical protein